MDRLASAARTPTPSIRGAAVEAMFDTRWPGCLPILRELAVDDEDPEFRSLAGTAADAAARRDPDAGPISVDVPDLFPDDGADIYRIAMEKLAPFRTQPDG